MTILPWLSTASSSNRGKVARQRHARLQLETLEAREVLYSASGNLWPQPQLITVSFVPDGTLVNGKPSNLQATFNAKFGSAATWQNIFKEAAQVWAAQTNINFNFVTDSGAASGSGSYRQGDSTFGDIRIGGYNFGNSTLAQAFLPPPVNNYSVAGDIQFNTSQTFNIGSTYNLFTVAAHEFGHALGLNHGAVGSIMASAYPGTVTALTTDDINGIRNIYSANAARAKDSYDAVASNETFATAKDITSTINTTSKTALVTDRDLSTSTDVDWYKFVLPAGSATTLKVKAVATGLSLLNPRVEIFNSSNVLQTSGNGGGYGTTATATKTSVAAGQTWYVKVSSTDAKAAFKTGKYALVLNMGTGADPTVPLPNTQVAAGSPQTSGGGVAVYEGTETRVNTSTTGSQGLTSSISVEMDGAAYPTPLPTGEPVISMDSVGNYVVVWTSAGTDGSGQGIYAKRFNSAGVAQGGEFRVNTTTSGDQSAPAVAMRSNGDFVVAWASFNQDASNTWGIYAQRYNAAGVAQGGQFKVNTRTAGDQISPAVTIDENGNFLIAWSSYGQDAAGGWGIYAQRYNASGTALGGEFRANTTTAGDQMTPGVAIDAQGNFAIGWSAYNQDAPGTWGYYFQRYFATGTPALGETRINETTAGDQRHAGAAMAPDGSWLAVWTSSGQDGDGLGVYARRYDAYGMPKGAEFRVNTTTAGDQTNPTVTKDRYGNFYVAWASQNQDGSGWGIYGQQFSATGERIEGEFRVNSTTAGDQVSPAAAMDSSGHLVVVWNGNGTGDSDGIFTQRYSVNTALDNPGVFDVYDPEGHGHEEADHATDTDTVPTVEVPPQEAPPVDSPPGQAEEQPAPPATPVVPPSQHGATQGSVSGRVYEDRNGNNVFDAGDVPGAGVLVTITGIDFQGREVSRTRFTNSAGEFSFGNLEPSNKDGYNLTYSQGSKYQALAAIQGADGSVTPGAASMLLSVAEGGELVGFDFTFARKSQTARSRIAQ